MSGQERKTGKRVLNVGLLAHVDAGKTTLSESILYQSGAIRNLGRVDHQDAFLDTDEMERERGITIFSKQAVLTLSGELSDKEIKNTVKEAGYKVTSIK
jgi:translation elongation factor EF-G